MPIHTVRSNWRFSHAALFAALLFLFPERTQALTMPDSVTLETDAFVQIMSQDEVNTWYTEKKRIAFAEDQ